MKVKIILIAKKEFIGLQKDETLTLINEIFDINNGIAFFPIDKKQWDVISFSLFTGLKDENKDDIYEGDKIRIKLANDTWGGTFKEKIGMVRYESDHGGYIVEWERENSFNQNYERLTCDIACEAEIRK